MQFLISTDQLTYGYESGAPILEDIALRVPQGSVYGLLGANGAGKTTLLQLLAGLLRAEKGSIALFGRSLPASIPEIYLNTGVLISEPQLYHHLSGYDNLCVFARYRNIPESRAEAVLELTGLSDAGKKKVGAYSTGMKQRLGIALALLPDPELLILDEPTNGLDPQGIYDVRQLIRQLHDQQKKTILLSSHLLGEVEQVCSHLGILHRGQLAFQGTTGELARRRQEKPVMRLACADPAQAARLLSEQFFAAEQLPGGVLRIPLSDRKAVSQVIDLLRAAEIELYEFHTETPRLEDWFFELTKH